MIEYIKGRLIEKNPAYVVIENGGMGLMMNISLQTFSFLKDLEEVKLFTHLAFKVEATTPTGFILYGFAHKAERQLFKYLISVSGVGSSTALLMLSSLSSDKIYQAIQNGELATLQSVKGIGNKTAQRIIIDLQDKVSKESIGTEFLGIVHNTRKDEALIGLTTLGFNKTVAEKAVGKVLKLEPDLSVEKLIREALKIL
nr:Holliday junction branch migration protein RuvA [Bacteroidota bacterium]